MAEENKRLVGDSDEVKAWIKAMLNSKDQEKENDKPPEEGDYSEK